MSYFVFAQLPALKTTVDPGYLFVLLAAIVALIGLRIYNKYMETSKNPVKKKIKTKDGITIDTPEVTQEPNKKELNQIALLYGFSKEQMLFFTKLCKLNRITNPSHLVENKNELDKLLSRTFNQLQATIPSTRETEKSKTLLFTIREAIENKKRAAKLITSTKSLQNNQPFTLITKDDEHYQMTILDNSSDGLLCLIPRDSFGNELRLALWSKIRCFFYTRSGQSYQFNSRILRYESGKNETRIVLSHSNSIKAMPNRNHARKLFETACYFAHVSVANIVNGKHTEHKFYPSPRSFGGIIMDISVGGCSIRTKEPLAQGEYIQIICNLEEKIEDIIIGKIIRVVIPEDTTNPLMHIQFAKMSRATMNRIFSYIYNEGEHKK